MGVIKMNDKVDGAINFVWSYVGKQLQQKDKKRMLAIAQQNPEHHLSVITNIEIESLIDSIFEKEIIILDEKDLKAIIELNEKDNSFREISQFMRYSKDMLSIGSTITGQIEQEKAYMKIKYPKGDENE